MTTSPDYYFSPPIATVHDSRTIAIVLEYGTDTDISVGCIDSSNTYYAFERIYVGC